MQAGTTNPEVKLWQVDMSDPQNLKAEEIKPPLLFRSRYEELTRLFPNVWKADLFSIRSILSDYYFTAVSWAKSESVAVIWMNRAQNLSLVTECNPPAFICKEVSPSLLTKINIYTHTPHINRRLLVVVVAKKAKKPCKH